jgi:uncharacterized coiled-coil protein SlyX
MQLQRRRQPGRGGLLEIPARVILLSNPAGEDASMRAIPLFLCAVVIVAACTSAPPAAQSPVPGPAPSGRAVAETVTVRDVDLERRIARMELQLLERDARIEELTTALSDTREEVVRTMAKLRSATSRAEAASGVAEAEVALQTLRSTPGAPESAELAQVSALVRRSAQEFSRENFGGALYLATEAKSIANIVRARLSADRESPRAGETRLAVPVRLEVSSRGNVREGPGTTYAVLFSVNAGTMLTGVSYTDDWIRITDDQGRSGWIYRSLVGRP